MYGVRFQNRSKYSRDDIQELVATSFNLAKSAGFGYSNCGRLYFRVRITLEFDLTSM
jgi:hypothetical protein